MFKALKIFFGFFVLLVIVLIIGVAVFVKTFDLNKYKSYAEEMVYKQTGRTLSLKGETGLKISLVPTLVLNDVALSNADWATPADMVTAQKIEVSLDVLPLLKKQIVINTVELIKPEIYLSVNTDGTPNWRFQTGSESASESSASESKTSDTTEVSPVEATAAMAVVAKHLQISDGKIVYEDLKNKSTQQVSVNSVNLTSDGTDARINLDFDVIYNDQSITGQLQTGSINAVLQNQKDFPLTGSVTAYGVTLQADLKLNNLMGDLTYQGSLKVRNPKGNFGAPAVTLATDLSGSLQNVKAVLNELNVAGNIITGTVSADLSQTKPYIDADLISDVIDLQTLTTGAKTALNFSLISTAEAAAYVPETALDLSALKLVNARLKLNLKKLIVNSDLDVENITLSATLKKGTLTLSSLTAQAGQGTLSASGSVSAAGRLTADISGKKIILQDLIKSLALKDSKAFGIQSGGQTDLQIKLSGQGSNLRQLVESLNGQILFVIGESTLQTGSLKYLSGNFVTQILNTLNLSTTKNMTLQCAVVRADLADGKAQFPKGVVFNADQLSIVGDGSVNLVNDKLNLTLHPFNNKLTDTNIAQALTSLLKISGTVEDPKLTLDNASVIKNVVGVAAAGPAYLGSQLVLENDEAPCYTALKDTDFKNMFSAPTGVKATTQDVYQDAGNLIKESVSSVTDTAKDLLKALKNK